MQARDNIDFTFLSPTPRAEQRQTGTEARSKSFVHAAACRSRRAGGAPPAAATSDSLAAVAAWTTHVCPVDRSGTDTRSSLCVTGAMGCNSSKDAVMPLQPTNNHREPLMVMPVNPVQAMVNGVQQEAHQQMNNVHQRVEQGKMEVAHRVDHYKKDVVQKVVDEIGEHANFLF